VGGWPNILERIEGGETIAQIGHSFAVSRGFFARLLYEERERRERVLQARKTAADALVDGAQEILDSASATQYELQRAKLRAEFRVWLASKLNRELYGDGKPTQKWVTLGELHLDALRARPTTDSPRPPPLARAVVARTDRARVRANKRRRR
jgi:hypothetical protein